MYLTLEVISPQAVSLGAQRRRVVGANGLTIGRVAGNDWVIPDPYISRQHARINCASGGFTVEGLGRNPIAIDRPENIIPSCQPHVLKNGDHLFIDQYHILVTSHPGDPSQADRAVASDDPFGIVDPAAEAGVSAEKPLLPGGWAEGPAGVIAGSALQLDPLRVLRAGPPSAVPGPTPVNLQPDSPLRDALAPSLLRAVLSPPSDVAAIPGNWDRPADVIATDLPSDVPAGIPANWDRSLSPPQTPPIRRAVVDDPRVQPSVRITPRREAARASPRAARSRTVVLRPATTPAATAAPVALKSATSPASETPRGAPSGHPAEPGSLAELLCAAGLSGRDASPETLRELGQVLRIVVQGVMEVLHARTDIKAQFRLPQTRVQARENNPLKLSPNAESALHTLLVQRNAAYLTTVQAFEEAFADIRNHQLALLEGVRVAFASMLDAFDPQELQKGFDGVVKRGGPLSGVLGGKSKYWSLYVERFTALQRDADDTFRRLFGDVFAQAYERQLERLKSPAGRRN